MTAEDARPTWKDAFGSWDGPIATLLGSGLSPWAPGTVGSAVALILGVFCLSPYNVVMQVMIIVVASLIGLFACDRFGKRLGVHDHGSIVWDELCGMWIAMIAATGWLEWLVAFGLFRLFDIAKPWPVSWADRQLPGGYGVMVDDILAGLYALGIMSLWRWWV